MRESIPINWRRIPERYRMEGTKCDNCKKFYFPPRKVCPNCRRKGKIVPYTFSGKGKIYSYSTVFAGPIGFETSTPYIIAIIKLDEGAKVLGQIVDINEKDIQIGDKVDMVFRKIQQHDPEGVINYGFKFRKVK